MLGGSATNVAVAAAQLGHAASLITKVGDDPFGVYARRAMSEFGVDPSRVGTHPTLRMPTTSPSPTANVSYKERSGV
jgi:5-dehydro-2-deoxygluconokinase